MNFDSIKNIKSHGNGLFNPSDFKIYGEGIVIENGVLVFHPETISVYDKVYIGHNTILKGYHYNEMIISEGSWIGQNCFFHSAGGIFIGKAVGIAPCVKILTSSHNLENKGLPIINNPLELNKVFIKDGADIGIGAIILPGVTIGEGAVIGAGSVVTKNIEDYCIYAGNPARFIKKR